jgi:hypothetical protein
VEVQLGIDEVMKVNWSRRRSRLLRKGDTLDYLTLDGFIAITVWVNRHHEYNGWLLKSVFGLETHAVGADSLTYNV